MKVASPQCGSAAAVTGRKHYQYTSAEFTYRCGNDRCQSTFTGTLTLSLPRPPGIQDFSAKPPAIGATPLSTDC